MKKKIVVVACLLLLMATAYGQMAHPKKVEPAVKSAQPSKYDKAFRNYLVKSAGMQHLEQVETASVGDSSVSNKLIFDVPSKSYVISTDVQCSVSNVANVASISMTLQSEHDKLYIRLNDIKGQVTFSSAGVIDLATLYANDLGKWYTDNNIDGGLQTEFSQGVYFFGSSIMAPKYNAQKIADAIIKNKAITYAPVSQADGQFTFKLTSHRQEYIKAASSVFYDVVSQESAINELFEDSTILESTITITADGQLVEEKPYVTNPCRQLTGMFIGTNPTGIPLQQKASSVSKPQGSLVITPVSNPRSMDDMTGRQTIYRLHTGQ